MSRLVTAADKAVSAVYVVTDNDRNGNPRRGWVVRAADGRMVEWVEEGYEGRSALEDRWPQYGYETKEWWNHNRGANLRTAYDLPVNVSAKEYRRLKGCGDALARQWHELGKSDESAGAIGRADKRQAITRAARDAHGYLPRA